MQATISKVFSQTREWNNPQFPGSCSVAGMFEDGSRFEYATKIPKASEIIEALTALIGKPGEFEVEPKPDYNGTKQYKLRSYPGKPSFSGGGRTFVPAYHQTKEGFEAEQLCMNKRTALMQAVQAVEPDSAPERILNYADAFFEWFQGVMEVLPSQTVGRPQNGNEGAIWGGAGQCPTCHAPSGKLHGKQCVS